MGCRQVPTTSRMLASLLLLASACAALRTSQGLPLLQNILGLEHQKHLHRLSSLQVHNQRVTALLAGEMLHHVFSLPEAQLRRGLVYQGSGGRLRAAVAKAMRGEPVKIGVIGASAVNPRFVIRTHAWAARACMRGCMGGEECACMGGQRA